MKNFKNKLTFNVTNRFALAAAASLVALCFTTATYAADDHQSHAHDAKTTQAHAHESKAQHGGVVSVVKDMNYELVAKDGEVALYVSDHGNPVDLAGATAKLTMLSGTQKQDVVLTPVDNALRAQGAFTAPTGTKAVVSLQLKGQPKSSARFTLP